MVRIQDCEMLHSHAAYGLLFTLDDSHVTLMHLWLVKFDLYLKMNLQVIFDIGPVWQYL
jgi:hypothetical protein